MNNYLCNTNESESVSESDYFSLRIGISNRYLNRLVKLESGISSWNGPMAVQAECETLQVILSYDFI